MRKIIKATNETIKKIIQQEIAKYGNKADLNHIDVSEVTDMRWLFSNFKFNGDISQWNVSNVKDMCTMFYKSRFNGDISQWNVENVTDMRFMFECSQFNGDLNLWKTYSVISKKDCFKDSLLEKENKLPYWAYFDEENMRILVNQHWNKIEEDLIKEEIKKINTSKVKQNRIKF